MFLIGKKICGVAINFRGHGSMVGTIVVGLAKFAG